MNEKASADIPEQLAPKLAEEAADALAQIVKVAEQPEVFSYFQSLLEFKKHASDPTRH